MWPEILDRFIPIQPCRAAHFGNQNQRTNFAKAHEMTERNAGALSQLGAEIGAAKTCKWRNLSVAVWRPELRAAEVLRSAKGRGADWQRLGFERERRQYLFIEDALLLAERALLAVVDGAGESAEAVPLRRLWDFMAWEGVDLRCYLAYKHLREQGFIVRRCRPDYGVPQLFRAASALDSARGAAAFEVFAPRAGFSRAKPGPAAFVLLVCELDDPVPELVQLAAVQRAAGADELVAPPPQFKVCAVDSDGTALLFDVG